MTHDRQASSPIGDGDETAFARVVPDEWRQLGVRVVDRLSVVEISDAEVHSEGGAIRAPGVQLHRLIDDGHTRLLLNLGGVRSI